VEETQVINAAENPALANKLVAEATKESKTKEKAKVVPPYDSVVTLPGGYVTLEGEVITEAEVRELTGRDEELIFKANNAGKMLTTILNRGTVRIGDVEATEDVLDQMFAGDRDALLLGIYRATFGPEAEVDAYCSGCSDYKSLLIDINDDIEVKKLTDVFADAKFEVKGKKNTYTCVLPTGKTQKELLTSSDKTLAELTTILLAGSVREINGRAVINRTQIQEIGISDRRVLAEELTNRSFGPVVEKVEAECPDCGGKVVTPISIGSLFRF
jgi:hypothetical protein